MRSNASRRRCEITFARRNCGRSAGRAVGAGGVRQSGDSFAHSVDGFFGSVGADLDRFSGPMEVKPSDLAEPGADQYVGRVTGKSRARDSVLHHIERFDHHGRDSGAAAAAKKLATEDAFAAEYRQ